VPDERVYIDVRAEKVTKPSTGDGIPRRRHPSILLKEALSGNFLTLDGMPRK